MDKQNTGEKLAILRGLLFVRLVFVGPFLLLVIDPDCERPAALGVILLLLAMAGLPVGLYFLRRPLLGHARAPAILAVGDFVVVSLVNLIASQCHGLPLLFPLYFIVAIEAACWWGWTGALISGAASGLVLSWLFAGPIVSELNLKLAMIALNLGWPVVLGYFTQWILRQWRERQRIAGWLARQEELVRRVQDHIQSWQEVWEDLWQAATPEDLLRLTLQKAQAVTGSTLGLVVSRHPQRGTLGVECWDGFALPTPGQTSLRCGEELPMPDGGTVRVRHVLEVPLGVAAPDNGPADLGRLIVARSADEPYREEEKRWLQVLAGVSATLLENRFLKGRLGQLHEEADSVVLAGWTLASLPDPAAAMEMACRNILDTFDLQQVVIFLCDQGEPPGYRVIVYSAGEPVRNVTVSLQGKGLHMLRRLLDSGTSLIINRRGEWPELFERMGWEEAQAVASFPLFVLEHRWGVLCMLSRVADAFPPHTQQNLAIFSGEVALALENHYLRQAVARAGSS